MRQSRNLRSPSGRTKLAQRMAVNATAPRPLGLLATPTYPLTRYGAPRSAFAYHVLARQLLGVRVGGAEEHVDPLVLAGELVTAADSLLPQDREPPQSARALARVELLVVWRR